jgi:hypothetical protein
MRGCPMHRGDGVEKSWAAVHLGCRAPVYLRGMLQGRIFLQRSCFYFTLARKASYFLTVFKFIQPC